MEELPEILRVSACRALLGEIYPSIRAVAIKYSKDKHLIIRYYLDREPTENDYENILVVETEIFAAMGYLIEDSDVECIYDSGLLSELNPLDGFVYARREY